MYKSLVVLIIAMSLISGVVASSAEQGERKRKRSELQELVLAERKTNHSMITALVKYELGMPLPDLFPEQFYQKVFQAFGIKLSDYLAFSSSVESLLEKDPTFAKTKSNPTDYFKRISLKLLHHPCNLQEEQVESGLRFLLVYSPIKTIFSEYCRTWFVIADALLRYGCHQSKYKPWKSNIEDKVIEIVSSKLFKEESYGPLYLVYCKLQNIHGIEVADILAPQLYWINSHSIAGNSDPYAVLCFYRYIDEQILTLHFDAFDHYMTRVAELTLMSLGMTHINGHL